MSFSGVSWGYNWGYPANGLSGRFEYLPMLWGNPTGNTQYVSAWTAEAQSAYSQGSSHLLSFNEPDINGISPQDAAKAYITYMNPYASHYQLGAPAVTNGGGTTGLGWLQSFLNACNGQCHIDFVPIHWYNEHTQVQDFVSHLQQAQNIAGGRPIWLTEFEGTCGGNSCADGLQAQFLRTVLPWLDSQAWIARYAYFGVFNGLLVNNGQLSQAGHEYGGEGRINGTAPTSLVA